MLFSPPEVDPIDPVGIGLGNIAKPDVAATKSEMTPNIPDGTNNADGFPKAIATRMLPKHQFEMRPPARERLQIFEFMVHLMALSILLTGILKFQAILFCKNY